MTKGGSGLAELKSAANWVFREHTAASSAWEWVRSFLLPRISGKDREIEKSLPSLFIGLFSPFSFVAESKKEVKDGLSEVIIGIKQYFKEFQTCFHAVLL